MRRAGRRIARSGVALLLVLAAGTAICFLGCRAPSLPVGTPTPPTFFTSRATDTRFRVAEHMMASIEMQISGEPFAELLGRDLAQFARGSVTPNLYFDAAANLTVVDPLGFSLAIESYEYSKQPMNNTSFESGAGLSLQFAPLLNPTGLLADDAFVLLRDRLQHLAEASSTAGPPGSNWVVSPAPEDNPLNVYGWPGLWPVFAEFQSFKSEIEPAGGATRGCSFTFGYGASALGAQAVGDYECGYNSLNLPNRNQRVDKILDPAALGFALWKQGLWTINYWQSLHDSAGNPITEVAEADLPGVGLPDNQVVGRYPDPADPSGRTLIAGFPGTWLGGVPLEGWQGLLMLEEMDNKSAFTLRTLLTSDGSQLAGFASTRDALAYDHTSLLRWWPAAVSVTETAMQPAGGRTWKYFPRPEKLTIESGASRLRGLVAMAGGYAQLFALADRRNPSVGALPGARATFDGDPFPADNGVTDGEESTRDRALGNLKVALVNADRLHFDPVRRVLVDEATVVAGEVRRGSSVSTLDAAWALVGLRGALRSISSTLALYSNDTPDTRGLPTALDATANAGSPGGASLSARTLEILRAEADFLDGKLVAADGAVHNGYDLATGAPDPSPTRVESEAAALRGLLEAYLITGDTKYRRSAARVYADLERRFWMNDVRAFRTTAGVSDVLTFTPVAFGTLQGALRQYWKLVARNPGDERTAAELLERLMRLNKLVLNGWDDANADNVVQFPAECAGAGLQMAERALTGENSRPRDRGDRDHDCVLEIAEAGLPAALASEVVFRRR